MTREQEEHLLGVKLAVEKTQLLLEDFMVRYGALRQVRSLLGKSDSKMIAELLQISFAVDALKDAAHFIHLSVNVEEV